MFPWSKEHRRHELLQQPFPAEWLGYVQANVAQYPTLSAEEQQKLQDITRVLVAEKSWEGCGGLTLTDEMTVTIAVQASLLLLGLEHDYYGNVETVLVYPQSFLVPEGRRGEGRVIDEGTGAGGLAALRGPVVVSWEDARAGGRNRSDGRNVVLHEFAHKLDMRDGTADGAPYLRDAAQVDEWGRVMSAEFQSLVAQTQAGKKTFLNPYGATNAAEFFAVATEYFFEKSREMQREHPELYDVLHGYYGQDTAVRLGTNGRK